MENTARKSAVEVTDNTNGASVQQKWNHATNVTTKTTLWHVQEIKCKNTEAYFLGSLYEKDKILNPWFDKLQICVTLMKFKIDTGIGISFISHKT